MNDFPMPKTVEIATQFRDRTEYAPKRGLSDAGLAAVSEAVERDRPATLGQGGGSGYKPPADYKAPRHQDAIRETLKKLTHREMKELTLAIFAAAKSDSIARDDLPDVFDRFAYGD
jgi:hypothetical protein